MKITIKKIISLFLIIVNVSAFTSCKDDSSSSLKVNTENKSSEDIIYVKTSNNVYSNGAINNTTPHSYLDFNSMNNTILCSKPNCNHQTSECISQAVGETPIIYNDYIYFFSSTNGVKEESENRSFYIHSSLKRCSLDSSEIETITEFNDCVPREYDGCAIVNGVLYFCGDDMNPTEDEYGNILSSNLGGKHFLCGIDLSNGKYTNFGSIYDDSQYSSADSSSSAKIAGYYDSKIYLEYSFLKDDIPQEAYNDIFEPRDYFTILNFSYDIDSNQITESNLPSAAFMTEECYVYSNYPENSSTVIDNGKEYTIDGLDVNIYGKYYNGKVFMYDAWYDVNDSSKHSLGEYEGWNILSYYDDSYIFANNSFSKFVKLTEEELLALDKEA